MGQIAVGVYQKAQGAVAIAAGLSGEAGGAALTSTGAGAVVGVPAMAASAAVVAGGTVSAALGYVFMSGGRKNLGNDWKGGQESKESAESGQRKNPTKGESKVWKDLENIKGQDRKTSGIGKDKQYYEWDYTHNDIEVYDKKGKHIGSMDPTTGEIYKPAVPGRVIKIN